MTLLLIGGGAWATLSTALALLIGRSVRLADGREAAALPTYVPSSWTLPVDAR